MACGTPGSSRNAALAPVTGSHQAGRSTAEPRPLPSRSVPGAGNRASTGGATALVSPLIRRIPPRVGAKSPIALPPRNRVWSPERNSRPEEVEADVIQQNVLNKRKTYLWSDEKEDRSDIGSDVEPDNDRPFLAYVVISVLDRTTYYKSPFYRYDRFTARH